MKNRRVRPQVLVSIVFLGSIAVFSIYSSMVEIATGCITLIGALSMKIIESE